MLDDFVYYFTLATSIALGSYYKNIEDSETRRNYGTGLGIVIAFLICGRYVYHTFLMIWINIIILNCCDKRYIHHISLIYTWLHLLFLHINIINAPYVVWIHQTLALRLVGVAFEITSADKPITMPTSKVRMNIGGTNNVVSDSTIAEIISYAFFFVGLHKGPYYRFKIFKEHIRGSFGVLGDCRIITEQKLKKMLICLGTYWILKMKYSAEAYFFAIKFIGFPQIFNEPVFYMYDADTGYLYNIPLLVMFFLKCEVVMLLCSSVCTEAGFGVFPARCDALPGHGPSTKLSLLELANNLNKGAPADRVLNEEYNFSMLTCFQKEKLLFGPLMKDTLRSWDMPTRYWFWNNIYKGSIKASKEIRSACSFLAWAIWSGPSLQRLITSSTLWVYIQLESEYSGLYDTKGPMKIPWDIGFSIMRLFCLIYLTPCLFVKDTHTVLRYYNSIFWVMHIVMLFLIVGAILIYKSRNREIPARN